MNNWGTKILLVGIVVFAVIVVFIVLPGKKSPVYPKQPQPTPTSSHAVPGNFCPEALHGKTGAAANGKDYTCTKYTDGTWRWKEAK